MHQIGIGVLGPIYRTYDPSEDRLVAVKAFHLDITPEQSKALIDALAQVISSGLLSPTVVLPIAVGIEQDIPYLAQEYVAAESLDVALRHYVPATLNTALPFIVQMSEAIDSAHKNSILHGGLHLRDIFVTPDHARLTGFGVTKALEAIGLKGPVRRPYTSPEIITGREWGPEADYFSLAAIAYELLTGKRAAGIGEQITERLDSVTGVSDTESLQMVFSRALAQSPEMRFSSGADFVAALSAAIGDIDDENQTEMVSDVETINHEVSKGPVDLLEALGSHHDASLLGNDKISQDKVAPPDASEVDLTELDRDADIGKKSPEFENQSIQAGLVSKEIVDEFMEEVDSGAEMSGDSDDSGVSIVPSELELSPGEKQPIQHLFQEGIESEFITSKKPSHSKRWKLNRSTVALGVIVVFFVVGTYISSSFLTELSIVNDKTPDLQGAIISSEHDENEKLELDESSQETSNLQASSVVAIPGVVSPQERISSLQSDDLFMDQQRPSNVESEPVFNKENGSGWILVRTTPADAEVVIDGINRGRTPISVSGVSFGKHRIEVNLDGYNAQVQEVVLSPLSSVGAVGLKLDLAGIDLRTSASVGSMFVDSHPIGAHVIVDDRVFGETPLVISELVLGMHHVRIELDGYRVWETTVEVKLSEQVRVAASLDRRQIQ